MQLALTQEATTTSISQPEDIAKILHDILKTADTFDQDKEHLWGIYFNTRNKIIRIDLIGLGTLNASLVHPRELFRPGIEVAAASVMMCHNHPSGDATPSEADISITKRLKEAGEVLGIAYLDSIIIDGKGGHYSFRQERLI